MVFVDTSMAVMATGARRELIEYLEQRGAAGHTCGPVRAGRRGDIDHSDHEARVAKSY
jgi:hypothetical protein